LTVDERCCRGDWDAPKSEASNATIGVESCVIDRINRLKQLTVNVKAGRAVRHYKVVKSDRPEDLVFQSVKTGAPMRDNNILSRHIKPAARKLGLPWINWRCLRTSHATWMVEAGANPKRRARPDAALSHLDHDGHLCSVRARFTAARFGKDVGDGRVSHVQADCTGEHTQYRHPATIANGELASRKLFWSQLEPKSGGTTQCPFRDR
jgi:hypothetical protein